MDNNDIFDSALNLEQSHIASGYDLGYADGLISGKEDARQLGHKHGFQVVKELRFYKGCVNVWTSAILIEPDLFSAKVKKTVETMDGWIGKYVMESFRLQFKRICVNLGVKLAYVLLAAEASFVSF